MVLTKRGAVMIPEPEKVRFKKKSQVTIPNEFVKALGLHEGDDLQCRLEDGKIVFVPLVSIPKDQAWFWTEEWQKGEREADEDIKAGRVKSFGNAKDAINWLNSDEAEEWANEES